MTIWCGTPCILHISMHKYSSCLYLNLKDKVAVMTIFKVKLVNLRFENLYVANSTWLIFHVAHNLFIFDLLREWLARHGWKCSIVEKNFRIRLIPMIHFYGVHFWNKSRKSFVIFSESGWSKEEMLFYACWKYEKKYFKIEEL